MANEVIHLTEEEQKFADHVRTTNIFEFVLPEDYLPYPEQVKQEKLSIITRAGETPVYMTTPKKPATKRPVHISVHGGGFARGHHVRDEYYCAKMACLTDNIVFDIDYRLAPEYKFPVALREVYDVTKWIFDHADEFGGDAENVTMSGYSAGGNLICGANMLACDSKEFRVKRQILCYPALDLFTDGADKPQLPPDAPTIPLERGRIFNRLYLGATEIGASPYASPIFASDALLKALPETDIITAGKDGLKFEAADFAERMRQNGRDVFYKCFEQSRHGFIIMCMDEWLEAQELVVDRIIKK